MGSAPLRGLLHNRKGRHRGTQYRRPGHPGENKHCATSKRPMHWLKNTSSNEIFVLLGRSEVTDVLGQPIDLFWDVRQRRSVVSCRRFGTTYLYPSRMLKQSKNVGPIGCPETSVTSYHSSLRNISEERRSHLGRGARLKSRTYSPKIRYEVLTARGDDED